MKMAESANQDIDVVDGNCSGKTCETDDDKAEESPPLYSKYFAFMPTDRYSHFYNMNHKHRGHALIFNQRLFKRKEIRAGTLEDCEELQESLEHIGFNVHVYQDLRKHEIDNHIREASNWDHKNCDCFLIVVLSHGEVSTIYAADLAYKPEHVWGYFTPDKCPSLAGKPKIFIFDVGRGRNVDSGVTLLRRIRTEFDHHQRATYKIPLLADFLFAYSTPEGYITWCDSEGRSWYLKALCGELKRRAFSDHFLAILTHVNQRVALSYESVYLDDPTKNRVKQIPCFMSTLSRFLKFSPPKNNLVPPSTSDDVDNSNDNNNNN